MLKKLLLLCAALVLSMSAGFASAVEVNSADQAALESVKGIGPVYAKAIIDERKQHGPFKDADDLANRIKGIGTQSGANLAAEGLTVNGSSAPPSGAKASTPGHSTTKTTHKATASAPDTATTAEPATSASASEPADSNKKPRKKSKKAKSTASDDTANADATASDSPAQKPKKTKKAKKSKAASATADSAT
ncbi:ComEA family DNA-binding protein [Paraburkholderia hayleyella]|uniref:ComEA family DNA-binding protein n=1 Tax=Paraburkholderia hayleyella TaxID=2152889 RepID=UPI001292275A|nr:helix-hairpin-helix domain-containing protein [Paraburkholderia hayleyella]